MNIIFRDDVTQKLDARNFDPCFVRRVVRLWRCKEGSQSFYMSDGGVVQSDCIIEIHSDVFEAGRDMSHDGDESVGSAGGALRHTKPFEESVGGEEGSQGGSIRVDGEVSES